MKKALLFAALSSQFLIGAQENWGKIEFKTRNIPKSNGGGTYNVPLLDYDGGAGIGARPGGASIGLFLPGPPFSSPPPFATSVMGTTAISSFYPIFPTSQTVMVPGHRPGSRAVIIIRAWIGSSWENSFGSLPTGEWIFTTPPLGGVPPGGGDEIPTPSLTGWGPEDGTGITVTPWPPRAGIRGPADGAVFASPATVQITASYGGDPGCNATNFAVFVGSILVANEVPSPGVPRTYLTPPLGPGAYSLYSVAHAGYGSGSQFLFTGATQSIPINITVVDPVNISVTPPIIANSQLTFQYTVNPGLSYVVQQSIDLQSWQGIETNKPTSSPALFSRPLPNSPSGYYRVERIPNP
jgi:hypothetical protein